MEKEFKARANMASVIFLVAYTAYIGLLLFKNSFESLIPVIVLGILLYIFFLGCRPYKYTVEKKTLTIHYRLWKNKEIDLMTCEIICDPVSRWADIATRPHAIEIYTDARKRYCFSQKNVLISLVLFYKEIRELVAQYKIIQISIDNMVKSFVKKDVKLKNVK